MIGLTVLIYLESYCISYVYIFILQGGAEHGPILVSNLQSGKPAHSCGLLRIGDAILSVNGHNLRNSPHRDAVTVLDLQSVGEEVVMEVAYIADLVSDNSDEEGEQNHHQQQQQPLLTRDSSMPPQNKADSLNTLSQNMTHLIHRLIQIM